MNAMAYWRQMDGAGMAVHFAPFFLLLFFTAALPFIPFTSGWWEHMKNKFLVAALCAGAGIFLYVHPTGDYGKVLDTYFDYLTFLVLLGSLFTAAGGIYITGALAGFPSVNTILLGVGALLASFLGTTGASMVLIRPLLRANEPRRYKSHLVVFFIFIVSNCGGLLTPLGDPPLYLGFLKGVPFGWTFFRLFPIWVLTLFILLPVFYLLDARFFEKEDSPVRDLIAQRLVESAKGVRLEGWTSVLCLGGILSVGIVSGYSLNPFLEAHCGAHSQTLSRLIQIILMLGIAAFAYEWTPPEIHERNQFSFRPILEVAVLFFGVFGSMIPSLALWEAKGSAITVTRPWEYFWLSGFFSSFLDNAPTYLSATALAAGQNGISAAHLGELADKFPRILAAISAGSVLMGALSYIGNGPNFMVRAIAEQAGVKTPSFGGYMLWSAVILVPTFILITFVFF